MGKIGLRFQIKRGIADRASVDDDLIEVFDHCLELCKREKYEDAAQYLLPRMFFEWIWDNCDDDPSDYFETDPDIRFVCNEDNCSLRLGADGDDLVVTAEVSFEVNSARQIDEETIRNWIDEKALWSCGYISAGWSYSASDGDNVWLMSIDGKPAGTGRTLADLDSD